MSGLTEYNRLGAEEARQILTDEIEEIRHVKQWAEKAGYSVSKLQRIISHYYGMTAKETLKLIRYKRIIKLIKEDPSVTSYNVALNTGLKNEQDLYKFLKRNFNTSFTEIREDVSQIIIGKKTVVEQKGYK